MPEAPLQQSWRRRGLAMLLTGLALAGGVALWFSPATEEQNAVQQLPQAERQALYERTLRTLEVSCTESASRSGLYEYCRGQADFIRQFPECDSDCRAKVKAYDRRPSR